MPSAGMPSLCRRSVGELLRLAAEPCVLSESGPGGTQMVSRTGHTQHGVVPFQIGVELLSNLSRLFHIDNTVRVVAAADEVHCRNLAFNMGGDLGVVPCE